MNSIKNRNRTVMSFFSWSYWCIQYNRLSQLSFLYNYVNWTISRFVCLWLWWCYHVL